jgi:hypothetical protein
MLCHALVHTFKLRVAGDLLRGLVSAMLCHALVHTFHTSKLRVAGDLLVSKVNLFAIVRAL